MIPVIDLHCDTIPMMYKDRKEGKTDFLDKNQRQIDIEKMKKGGYLAQCFSVFTDLEQIKEWKETPYQHVKRLISLWEEEIGNNFGAIKKATTYEEIEKNRKEGVISAVMTVEEGAVYEGSMEKLHELYNFGVRISTLTWNYQNDLAYPNPGYGNPKQSSPDMTNGLTKLGMEFVEEMQRIGIIIDISHLNDAGIKEVFQISKKPVIASHSNARSVCGHLRNLTDENIKKIAQSGGVIGINYCPFFLDEKNQEYGKKEENTASIEAMIRHIEYIRSVGGIDCIALGSDFDGIEGKIEIEDASQMQKLADALSSRGFTTSEIEKIFYQNVLRVWKEM